VQNLQKLDRGLISKKHRGFFAKFSEILINELFSNDKDRGPGPRVRGPAGRAHRSTASGRSGAAKLTGRGTTERERSTRSSTRASPELGRWRGRRATAALGEREARAWREVKRGWERCGELRGWCSPFIGVGGAPGRGGRGG
jgi:hypothetical protein